MTVPYRGPRDIFASQLDRQYIVAPSLVRCQISWRDIVSFTAALQPGTNDWIIQINFALTDTFSVDIDLRETRGQTQPLDQVNMVLVDNSRCAFRTDSRFRNGSGTFRTRRDQVNMVPIGYNPSMVFRIDVIMGDGITSSLYDPHDSVTTLYFINRPMKAFVNFAPFGYTFSI